MKVLVISNFYPPHTIGGYELACAQVVTWLVSMGRDVTVLTQRGLPSSSAPGLAVLRRLFFSFLEGDRSATFKRRLLRQLAFDLWNYLALRLVVSRFKPDLIFVFNPSGLGGLLLEWLHRPRNRPIVVHDISDEMLLHAYQRDAWFLLPNLEVRTPFKRLVRDAIVRIGGWFLPSEPRPLALSRSYFRSQFLKDRFIAAGQREAAGAPVIYHGIELSSDRPDEAEATGRGREIAILFVGRLCREKGLHVLLRALATVRCEAAHLKLSVAGPSTDAAYREELEALIADLSGRCQVTMLGQISPSDVRRLLRTHAIFAFPVIWDEPFGISVLEAMDAALPIVATATGGSREILRHEENCLVVKRGDPESLADGLERLLNNPILCRQLGRNAKATVRSFAAQASFDRIGRHLQTVAELNNCGVRGAQTVRA